MIGSPEPSIIFCNLKQAEILVSTLLMILVDCLNVCMCRRVCVCVPMCMFVCVCVRAHAYAHARGHTLVSCGFNCS